MNKTHDTPCVEHEKLNEKFNTFRVIMYGCAVLALGIAIYLWQADDKHTDKYTSQAVAIGEIKQSLVYIQESQRRLEDMFLHRSEAIIATETIRLSSDAKALADETFLHGDPEKVKEE